MHHVYIPYIIGGDSPIPYLFEKILPSFDRRSFKFVTYKYYGEKYEVDGVDKKPMSSTRKWQRLFQYGRTSLRRYDLIHTGGRAPRHNPISKLARLRNPNINHIHSFRVDVDPESSFQTEKRRQLAEMADRTTAVSEHTAATVKQEFGFEPVVVHNGVDTDIFHPNYEQPRILDELNEIGPMFLFVGSLSSRKRPNDVLEVARRIPEATFLLIGDGPLYENLLTESRNLENVHILGRIEKNRLPAIYANVTAFLFPTTSEGCPNVVLEAMASGLPVIGYEATSMPELVTDGRTGYLAPTLDINQLVECVSILCGNNDENKRVVTSMGERARQYIRKNHTFSHVAKQYESLYLDLLS